MEFLLLPLVEMVAGILTAVASCVISFLCSSLGFGAIFSMIPEAVGSVLVGVLGPESKFAAFLLEVITPWTRKSSPPDSSNEDAAPPAQSPRLWPAMKRWARRALVALACTAAILAAAALVINTWFLDSLIRSGLAKQETLAATRINVDSIEASLFTGRCKLSGIHVIRLDHPSGNFDLTARSADVTFSLWSLAQPTVTIQSLSVDGLRGSFHRRKPVTETAAKGHRNQTADGSPPKSVRSFHIERLELSDLSLELTNHTAKSSVSIPFTIGHLHASPFRSQWAIFDVLFGSNAEGSLAGTPFKIDLNSEQSPRVTRWSASGLSLDSLNELLGKSLIPFIQAQCDVQVTHQWDLRSDGFVQMNWNLNFRNVHGEVPPDLTGAKRVLAMAVVNAINAKPREFPVNFSLRLDKKQFQTPDGHENSLLWGAVEEALAKEISKIAHPPLSPTPDPAKPGSPLDKAIKILEQFNKPPK